MKIEHTRVRLDDLAHGDAFLYSSTLFIKMPNYVACRVHDGEPVTLGGATDVTPVDAKVIV